MKTLEVRMKHLTQRIQQNHVKVMIIGLGSVGTYLLNYLLSMEDEAVEVIVVGRDYEKMESKVNITRVSTMIRGELKSKVQIYGGIDFNNISDLQHCIVECKPDFIVNSSRAYPGLKYGSISWENVRAYGIWSPLAAHFTKNIMEACEGAETNAIVINTSYSDAVIPWMKSAGKAYPDFGSGNLNHLVPRIKFAVGELFNIQDFWNIEVLLAVSHFHDVCISKEGQVEGVNPLLKVLYQGEKVEINEKELYQKCCIPMPADATRNQMNASSNFEIIKSMIRVVRKKTNYIFFSPGALGEIGGYPVEVSCFQKQLQAKIYDQEWSIEQMRKVNQESIALDGIENISEGYLFYTDALQEKCKSAFDVELPKKVHFDEIDDVAAWMIDTIIRPQLG